MFDRNVHIYLRLSYLRFDSAFKLVLNCAAVVLGLKQSISLRTGFMQVVLTKHAFATDGIKFGVVMILEKIVNN